MTLTLKRCPFCGGKPELRHVQAYKNDNFCKYYGWFVLCSTCLTTSNNYPSEQTAADHWNTRRYVD